MRGKLFDMLFNSVFVRITPADAGKTLFGILWYHDYEDHPRGCGENSETAFTAVRNTGSPPRMRGKPAQSECPQLELRITPADAGKTWGAQI